MKVLLFDIDGTLISTGGAGLAALRTAFTQLFGVADPQDVPVSGRTDRGIARELFDAHGIEDSPENWERFRDAYLAQLRLQLPRRPGRMLPGVPELLAGLAGRDRVLVGLLTGNTRDGARVKLEHFSIHQHFAFGGFGDRHANRDDVAAEALAAAREHNQGSHRHADHVWVIGDTPLDVRCARAIGARALAVATGGHPAEELAAAEPDLLLPDLSDTARLLNWLADGATPSV